MARVSTPKVNYVTNKTLNNITAVRVSVAYSLKSMAWYGCKPNNNNTYIDAQIILVLYSLRRLYTYFCALFGSFELVSKLCQGYFKVCLVVNY